METYQKYLNPQTLANLHGLELKARLIVEGYVSGLHKSPYHGFSIEFAEHREYVQGDDLRYVDWKVFGKSDRFYLKQYEEETNFACYFLLDTSESMLYRSEQAAVSKLGYAQFVCAALSYLILKQQDAVGLATFDNAVRNFVRAGSHPSHLKQVCHVMDIAGAKGETSMGPIFHDLAERIKKRGLVVILSDLFDDVPSLLLGLKHLRHRRHEVLVLHVVDPAEQDFPFQDPTLFKGLEGLPEQLTEPRSLRRAYQREFEHFLQEIRRGCRDLHMDYTLLRTDMPLDVALRTFLSGRARRLHRT
ncbi:MAG TPA: DUF58 domain-containing protein [Planctomycetaceae bacterium]|nr:DUF58 domain-containing protein [Planctomycetaceae bacterium]